MASLLPWLLLALIHATQVHSSQILPTFSSPPAPSRPKFRYWFPDASIPPAAVQSDIAAMAAVGAGGLQFLPFYNQGFPPVSTNWSTYGFGTPAFRELLRAALRETAGRGLTFDFAVGPNTAAGVPAVPGTQGLAMELVSGAKVVNGSARVGRVPGPVLEFNHAPLNGWVHEPENWGASEVVAVLVGKVKSRAKKSGKGEVVVLEAGSVVDVTSRLKGGEVDWETTGDRAASWVVMAFYQRYSNERSCVSVAQAPNWVGNGSWMVDHFSPAGAKKVTDFWDQQLLNDKEIDGLMRQVGMYSWEDSMEMMSTLWWTPEFLQRFERARGYSATKFLPAFFQAKNLWNGYGDPYDTTYTFEGEPNDGGKYAEDYRLTLTEGYQDFLAQHQKWAADRGMSHSTQPGYNMPLDMSAAIPLVGAPELESLGFGESIDTYRQFTGPAHLFNVNVISTEIGAQRGGAYAQTVPTLLNLFRDSFAAGVNTLVVHGFAYNGVYPGTTWPGYTPFQYEFCEIWGPRQPAWRHFNDTMLFAARTSEVLRTGVPKVDLVFYAWKHPWTARAVYQGAELTAAGFTHEYLGPDNLASTTAPVKDGILAPDGPGYKAIILLGQTKITVAASAALLKFAQAGLPIFIVGQAPSTTIGSSGQKEVSENIARLTNGGFANVKTVPASRFGPDVLRDAGLSPRVQAEALSGAPNATQLFSTWRSQPARGFDAVYLLNRGAETAFSISFAVPETSVPYILDAWTGEQTPILSYLRTGEGISTRITLSKGQSTIVAFTSVLSTDDIPLYVVSRTPNLARFALSPSGHLEGYISDDLEASALLSNNAEIALPPSPSPLPSLTLGPWRLSVESYAAPATLSTTSVSMNITTTTHPSPLPRLTPWTTIKGWERTSGIGTYRAAFSLAPTNSTSMNYTLHFTGQIQNTLRVWINGALVPAIDPAAPAEGRDITVLLRDGANEAAVEAASTLFNAVKARVNDVRSVGKGVQVPRYYTQVAWAEGGLSGEVVIRGLRRVVLA
ncbi:hypothetical protein B0T25DRAFT_451217 [Lasiosphaeria hispida]|uniref:Secreted protein n=1 Tax=Lasiosphaeria hispida TaxID=260671 RepID=A0AAJ0HKV0_9PEZI|nr:hypothetical protein B0T25DRAFT_451217 [Lasiosphaeria hispida]